MAAPCARLPVPFCRRPLPPDPGGGFALPLAIAAALVLLLATLASQSALHQERLRNAAALAQRQIEDGLASAAHQLVARVVHRHPCLLSLPLEHWPQAGVACADPAAQAALREGQIDDQAYRLLAWQPTALASALPGAVQLELMRPPGAQVPALRAAFRLDLQTDPPGVRALQELGLRGEQP